MRIAVVTGNPKPASRTHGVALAVAGVLSAALAGSPRVHLVVDLSEHAPVPVRPVGGRTVPADRRGRGR